MTTSAPLQNPGQTWRRAKGVLIASAIFGLVGTNLATLMSEDAHTASYKALSSALHALRLAELLSSSPSAVRATDVQVATATLAKRLDDLRGVHDAEVKRSANLEPEHLSLNQRHRTLDNENKAHIKKSVDQASAAKSISARLATRSAANAPSNLSSVPAEKIPVVGTAIVLGVTYWDLKARCQTVKDLNELNRAFDHQPVNHTEVCGMKVPTQSEALAKVKDNWRAVYATAAKSLEKVSTPVPPPQLSWIEIKEPVCSLLGHTYGICP